MRKTRGRKRTQIGGVVTTGKFINDDTGTVSRGAWDGKWSDDKKTWTGDYTALDRLGDSMYKQFTREKGQIYRQRYMAEQAERGKPVDKLPGEPGIPTYNAPTYKILDTSVDNTKNIEELKKKATTERAELIDLKTAIIDDTKGNMTEHAKQYLQLLTDRLYSIDTLLQHITVDRPRVTDINVAITALNALVQRDVVPEQQAKLPVYLIPDYRNVLIDTSIKHIQAALRDELDNLGELSGQYNDYIKKAPTDVDPAQETKYLDFLKTRFDQVKTLFDRITSATVTTSDIINELHKLDKIKFTGGRRRRSRRRSHRRSRRRR